MSSTRVFIGRLPHVARESDVERFFKGYGKIREISLKEGYGFVEFGDKRDAEDAVYELNGKDLCGERVIVDHARAPGERRGGRGRGGYGGGYGGGGYGGGGYGGGYGGRFRGGYDRYRGGARNPPPQHSDYRVRVSNVSSRVSWQDLKDYMRQAGEVVYADAHRIRANEGVVEFASSSDMKNAIEKLNDTELNGRMITITEDRGRDSGSRRKRSRSRSYSRSRSRSATRSRSRSPEARQSRDRSPSREQSPENMRTRSQSRSRSPSANNDDDQP